jgi:hypothetical protein
MRLVDILGVELLADRGEAGDVDEEDGDELALALDGRARDEDLIREVRRSVRLGGGEARRLAAARRGLRQRLAALLAETMAGGVRGPTLWTREDQPSPAFGAELSVGGGLALAAATLRAVPPLAEA